MPLRVKCPSGHVLIVPSKCAGTIVRCPRCDESVLVPLEGSAAVSPTTSPPADTIKPAPPRPRAAAAEVKPPPVTAPPIPASPAVAPPVIVPPASTSESVPPPPVQSTATPSQLREANREQIEATEREKKQKELQRQKLLEKRAAERRAEEKRLAQETAEAERVRAEQLAADKLERERIAREKRAREREALQRAAKLEKQRAAREAEAELAAAKEKEAAAIRAELALAKAQPEVPVTPLPAAAPVAAAISEPADSPTIGSEVLIIDGSTTSASPTEQPITFITDTRSTPTEIEFVDSTSAAPPPSDLFLETSGFTEAAANASSEPLQITDSGRGNVAADAAAAEVTIVTTTPTTSSELAFVESLPAPTSPAIPVIEVDVTSPPTSPGEVNITASGESTLAVEAIEPRSPAAKSTSQLTVSAASAPVLPVAASVASAVRSLATTHPLIAPASSGRRTSRAKTIACYQLAACVIIASLFGLAPAIWDFVEYLSVPDSAFIARWAILLVVAAVIQTGYAIYLIQLPDWSTVWMVTLAWLATATAYAMGLGLTLISGGSSAIVTALQLGDKLEGGRASLWCLCMMSVAILLAFFAGRLSVRWRTSDQLHGTYAN